jgi:sugar O-acyltransferase (sialic acid O-acetyltransferase NeuD family)
MENLVIFGSSEIAQIAYYFLKEQNKYNVVGFTVDTNFIKSNTFENLPLVPFEKIEKIYSPVNYRMFIALSYTNINKLRAQKFTEAKNKGYSFISYISPRATVYENVKIGENCFIFEDNTIQPYVKIGNNVTLWSGNHIGHHSVINDHCFISSHVVVSGGVTVGEYSFLGVNATIRDHIRIGKQCVIGAGAIIMHDTNDMEVYVPERTKLYKKRSDDLGKI